MITREQSKQFRGGKWALLLAALTAVGCAGPTGPEGKAGAPCTVVDNGDGTASITCPDGTNVTVSGGQNGTSCTVTSDADAGTRSIVCSDGTAVILNDGTNGTNGTNGTDGTNGSGANVQITTFHGIDAIMEEERLADAKTYVDLTITSATADATGVLTVNFEVKDKAGNALTTLTSAYGAVAKLAPAPSGEKSNNWVPYLNGIQTVTGTGAWPAPAGTWAYQASRESNGTLTNNNDGTYSYVFKLNLGTAAYPDGGAAIAYERDLLHRVSIMIGGHSGPTASATFDFVPDGSTAAETRDIVETATCQQCHGPLFAAHGGDRMDVGTCTVCHNTGTTDPHSGNTVDLKAMIHKIHAGGELQSIPGSDGIVWDNPATTTDESADNGDYSIWGYGNSRHTWWGVEFPAVIENCTKCHTGQGADVDAWKTNPSRAACGTCHDEVDFATGANHAGGAQANDNTCTTCHPATGTPGGIIAPITESHDWERDQRKQSEFNVGLSVSTPSNGNFFAAGEKPKVTVSLTPVAGGSVDHTTLATGSAQGCGLLADGGCGNAPDGTLSAANFMVHGPRARQNPVLSTRARVAVIAPAASGAGWNVASGNLSLIVDNGEDLLLKNAAGDFRASSKITVNVPTGGLVNADETAVMNWLNGNAAFSARAIAYLDEGTGRLAIRSRNLGKFFALQLQASTVNTAIFGGDVALHDIGGTTATNNIVTDVRSQKFADRIEYELDAVDDLKPGTYVVQAEIADRGRVSDTNYVTPSVKWTTFQVGTATEEKPVAANCNSCHQASSGKGYVLDYPRHHKLFGNDATDQCTGCHDYQNRDGVGPWTGAVAITRRVHAVHRGAHLDYPLITVSHSDGVPGRNWAIEFPQDIRNCQACHPDGTTSGTWKTNPSRLACGGCHDADAATAHLSAMTWDPTPYDPFSGDEQESCAVCHAVR